MLLGSDMTLAPSWSIGRELLRMPRAFKPFIAEVERHICTHTHTHILGGNTLCKTFCWRTSLAVGLFPTRSQATLSPLCPSGGFPASKAFKWDNLPTVSIIWSDTIVPCPLQDIQDLMLFSSTEHLLYLLTFFMLHNNAYFSQKAQEN